MQKIMTHAMPAGDSDRFLVETKSPTNCDAADLRAFIELVAQGGEVGLESLPGLVNRALALGFVRKDGVLVATGGIKRPNPPYRDRVFAKAGAGLDPSAFGYELGWVFVMPAERGHRLASQLVQALALAAGGVAVYATSRSDNPNMHRSLLSGGFSRVGAAYRSKSGESQIELFAREASTPA